MKRKINLATLLLVGALPLGAMAAEPMQGPATTPQSKDTVAAPAGKEEAPPLFKELDRNHDGYVTKEEAKRSADITARFKELDSDHDGKIAVTEFKNDAPPKM